MGTLRVLFLLSCVTLASCHVLISGRLVIGQNAVFEEMPGELVRVEAVNRSEVIGAARDVQARMVKGRTFQIGTALCIVWVIVGLKIIFCCTIVLRHEPKPTPFIRQNHFRIQQSAVRFRREEGQLVHLPEEEEEDATERSKVTGERSSGHVGVGRSVSAQESTTPPPPYSSLGIL